MRRKAFTLVEIMIVVGIIALLAVLAIPNLIRPRASANEALAQAALKTISTAAESYASVNDGNYPTGSDLSALYNVTPKYINKDYVADCTTTTPCQGYSYSCTLTTTSYSCTATAKTCGTTGTKNFTIVTGGALTSAVCS